MKKFAALCIGMGLMLTVTGCGNDITVDEQENDLVAEYIAGVMLKRSYEKGWDYHKLQAYMNENEQETTKATGINAIQKPTETEKSSQTAATAANSTTASQTTTAQTAPTKVSTQKQEIEPSAVSGEAEVMNALKSALGLSGVDIKYTQKITGNRYPSGQYLVGVSANKSCKIVALEFLITNNTSNDIVANAASNKVSMRLGVDGTTVVKSASILKNDITGLKNVTIPAGQTYTACAVFQVPEMFMDSIDKSELTLSVYASGTALGKMVIQEQTEEATKQQ